MLDHLDRPNGMCVDMRKNLRTDMLTDMCIDMRMHICIDIFVDFVWACAPGHAVAPMASGPVI